MENNSIDNGERKYVVLGGGVAVLHRVVREDLSLRNLKESKRASHVAIWAGNTPDEGKTKYKGPGAEACLVCLRNSRSQCVITAGARPRVARGEVRMRRGLSQGTFSLIMRMGCCWRRAEARQDPPGCWNEFWQWGSTGWRAERWMHLGGDPGRAETWSGRTASTPAHRALPTCPCFHHLPRSCDIVCAIVVFLLTF